MVVNREKLPKSSIEKCWQFVLVVLWLVLVVCLVQGKVTNSMRFGHNSALWSPVEPMSSGSEAVLLPSFLARCWDGVRRCQASQQDGRLLGKAQSHECYVSATVLGGVQPLIVHRRWTMRGRENLREKSSMEKNLWIIRHSPISDTSDKWSPSLVYKLLQLAQLCILHISFR